MHVVVNAAASADGKLSSRRREQIAISGEADFARVDRLRAASDAVVVGVGTVLADDPHLTVKDEELRSQRREDGRPANPARVVVDSSGRTPADAAILDDAATTYVCLSEAVPVDRRMALADHAELVTAGEERVDLLRAFATLQEQGFERDHGRGRRRTHLLAVRGRTGRRATDVRRPNDHRRPRRPDAGRRRRRGSSPTFRRSSSRTSTGSTTVSC